MLFGSHRRLESEESCDDCEELEGSGVSGAIAIMKTRHFRVA